jgi:hypothetical protein
VGPCKSFATTKRQQLRVIVVVVCWLNFMPCYKKKTSLPTTAAAGSPTPATLLPQPFFFFFSQLGTCFKQLSDTLQANQEAAAAACARSKLWEPREGQT